MGRAGLGRPATPTALKLVKGTRKDRINTAEPLPGDEEVHVPASLSDQAREIWDRLAPDLAAKKVLTPWDTDAFAAFCEVVVRNREANTDLATNGTTLTVVAKELRDGTVIYSTTKNPAWEVARESARLIATLGGRFGLNPSDRAGLKVGDGKDTNPKERYLTS